MIEFEMEWRDRLAIAVANVEAFADGKLEPTPRRLRAVLESLSAIEALLIRVSSKAPASPQIASPFYGEGNDGRA